MKESKYIDGEPIMHDFHALCKAGHKRNFVWADDTYEKKTMVKSRCVICDKVTEFHVKNYWQEPVLESKFKIG